MGRLIDELSENHRDAFASLRKDVQQTLGAKPKLEWMGITWKWCESTPPPDPSGKLLAVHLIPDPETPRVALTIATAFFETHAPASLPRPLQAGLGDAVSIGRQTWCEWPVASRDVAEAVLKLITLTQEQ